uniref:Uncharacterized protein n=1 Tax=Arundo donax TaxID=35708 RepID=A0A0A9EYN0_ARUDO
MASAFLTSFTGPMMNTLSGGPLAPPIWISTLQDSFTAFIDDPFLPITRPIFPGGTSKTDRISTSGT